MTPQPENDVLRSLAAGVRIYDLAQPLGSSIPTSPSHPRFEMTLRRRHGDQVDTDGASSANETIVMGGHVGTHVDALAHESLDGRLHGGASASEAQRGGRFSTHGIEEFQPLVCRGVLLDIPRLKDVDVLAPGYAITDQDCVRATAMAELEVRRGDAVLFRSGWSRYWDDPRAFVGEMSGVPGPDLSAAAWLADSGAAIAGGETLAFEQCTAELGLSYLPVHTFLLVGHGVYIVEMLNLESLAADSVFEFAFVLAPLKILGATGSPVRPLALV